MVLDSPFEDLWTLAQELVANTEIKIPSLAIGMVRPLIRNSVQKRADFNIDGTLRTSSPVASCSLLTATLCLMSGSVVRFERHQRHPEMRRAGLVCCGDRRCVRGFSSC